MTISPDRLENLRSRIERAEDAAKHLDGDIGRMWAERYAGDVTFLLDALAAPSPETGTAAVLTAPCCKDATSIDNVAGQPRYWVCRVHAGVRWAASEADPGPAPEPVKPPSPGTGEPGPTHEKPPHKWFPEPGVGWKCGHCFALRRVHGCGETETKMDYQLRGGRTWLDYEPDCIGEFAAVPAASSGTGEPEQAERENPWPPAADPAVPAAEPVKPPDEPRSMKQIADELRDGKFQGVLPERPCSACGKPTRERAKSSWKRVNGKSFCNIECAGAFLDAAGAAAAGPAAEPGKPATCSCGRESWEAHELSCPEARP